MSDNKHPMIYAALAGVMMDVKHVAKNQVNQQQRFNFRGIDDLYNATHAALAKHQVFTTSEVTDRLREERTTAKGGKMTVTVLRVKYTFHAIDGSSVSTETEGESADSGDKSTSKALAMADKYALIQMFKIPTDDMPDADKESYLLESKPRITDEQVKSVSRRMAEYSVNTAQFMKWLKSMKIDSVESIPADIYSVIDEKLEAKKPAKAAA